MPRLTTWLCTDNVTTFTNYKRSRTGCSCCGREQVSSKLTNREFSQETINRQSESAYSRQSHVVKRGRTWRKATKIKRRR
jgi:hypothetical protein